jgi:glycosyltransferase involved in cell wall biosynthesis
MKHRLCVALPVRNGENYLSQALDSIFAQSFGDFELFVSDNASTDGTSAILADYARKDKRLIVSRADQMLELGANMNRAMAMANTPWVKLFCHDDLMRHDCLARINHALDTIENTNVALLANADRLLLLNGHVTEEVESADPIFIEGIQGVREFFHGSRNWQMAAVTTATVRKDVFDRIGRFDSRFAHFDTFCWLKLMTVADFLYLPETLTTIRVHEEQVFLASRQSMQWCEDYRVFVPEFLETHADQLQLSRWTKARARMMPINIAAKSIALEIIDGRPGGLWGMIRKVPVAWLPFLPPLMIRALRTFRNQQKARSDAMGRMVD